MQKPTEKPLKDYQSTIKMLLLSTTATVQDISFIEDSARLGKKIVTVYVRIYMCVFIIHTGLQYWAWVGPAQWCIA